MKKISSGSISDFSLENDREQSRQVGEARVAVVTWMRLARKSSGQVQEYLRQKGFADEIIQLALGSLTEDGTIDDRLLAEKLVRQRQGRSAESSTALRQRMQRLGLKKNVIEAAMPDAMADETTAAQLVKDRFGERLTDVRKAARFLTSRGFSHEVVNRVLREYFPGIELQD